MRCMVDLETMGTGPDAAIASIGAVLFDPLGDGDGLIPGEGRGEWYRRVSLADAMAQGGRADAPTILWWLQRSEAARSELVGRSESMLESLSSLSYWMRLHGVDEVWANGADFDLPILAGAYRRASIAKPWEFRQQRCFRTLRALYPHAEKTVQSDEAEARHHALADARWRARVAVAILREMRMDQVYRQRAMLAVEAPAAGTACGMADIGTAARTIGTSVPGAVVAQVAVPSGTQGA